LFFVAVIDRQFHCSLIMSEKESVDIRLANLEDAPVIAKYTRQIALETEQTQLDHGVVLRGVQNGLKNNKFGFYVVAQTEDQIIGCLLVTYEWSDWRNGVQWWLQSVYVDSQYRKVGVFRQLFEFVVKCARREHNVCGIRLYVDQSNTAALSTYESLGMLQTNYLMYEMPLLD